MDRQAALRKVLDAHREHLFGGETAGEYPIDAVDALLNAMGELAQAQPAPIPTPSPVNPTHAGTGGDTLHINANGGATKVSIKGDKNSRGMNWEYRIEETAKGAEDLSLLQARVERAFEAGCRRMTEKYGAPGAEKG